MCPTSHGNARARREQAAVPCEPPYSPRPLQANKKEQARMLVSLKQAQQAPVLHLRACLQLSARLPPKSFCCSIAERHNPRRSSNSSIVGLPVSPTSSCLQTAWASSSLTVSCKYLCASWFLGSPALLVCGWSCSKPIFEPFWVFRQFSFLVPKG